MRNDKTGVCHRDHRPPVKARRQAIKRCLHAAQEFLPALSAGRKRAIRLGDQIEAAVYLAICFPGKAICRARMQLTQVTIQLDRAKAQLARQHLGGLPGAQYRAR